MIAAACVASEADAEALVRTVRALLKPDGSACARPGARVRESDSGSARLAPPQVVCTSPESRYGTQHVGPAAARLGLTLARERVRPAAAATPLLAESSGWAPTMEFDVYRITL